MSPQIVIPTKGRMTRRVLRERVHSIVCHRNKYGEEHYLVRWKTHAPTQKPPLSWHTIHELARSLEFVQDYLETLSPIQSDAPSIAHPSRKRKSPDTETVFERRSSPFAPLGESRTPSLERSTSGASTPTVASSFASTDVYNGVLDSKDGYFFAKSSSALDVVKIDLSKVPTPEMLFTAQQAKTDHSKAMIRAAYTRKLSNVPGKPIHLINTYDTSTPSLRFKYITEYVLREGVYKLDAAAQVGCKQCSPHMGRDIGCEYTKKCECMEYAAVDESRLTTPELVAAFEEAQATGGSTMGFPKRFPYFAESTKVERVGCLVSFYLNSRRPIYECNDKCNCGPFCRNKNVQFGRTVELEIFRTAGGRGWGLRCREDLHQGQFIDTYRGEVITDAEATRREAQSSKAKASYLYSLDKFQESEGLDDADIYVVDGEFMGGPTKFMNHSCDPNCRQYTVSYNKHDCRIYDLAFFACRDIPAGEELTFDYLDKDEDEDDEVQEISEDAIPCLCGAQKCRRWLWT